MDYGPWTRFSSWGSSTSPLIPLQMVANILIIRQLLHTDSRWSKKALTSLMSVENQRDLVQIACLLKKSKLAYCQSLKPLPNTA